MEHKKSTKSLGRYGLTLHLPILRGPKARISRETRLGSGKTPIRRANKNSQVVNLPSNSHFWTPRNGEVNFPPHDYLGESDISLQKCVLTCFYKKNENRRPGNGPRPESITPAPRATVAFEKSSRFIASFFIEITKNPISVNPNRIL